MNIRQPYFNHSMDVFAGSTIDVNTLSNYYKFALGFFVQQKNLANFRIETTTEIDITDIVINYERNYQEQDKTKPQKSFTTFFKWILLKAMHDTPFNWRYLNDKWYN